MKKLVSLTLVLLMVFALAAPAFAAPSADAVASAVVERLNGSQNRLIITIKVAGATVASETFMIANNAKGNYQVGDYKVYVATSGNTKIDACYIVTDAPDAPIQFLVRFYTLDACRVVCEQYVQIGKMINGADYDLYNSWYTPEILAENYELPPAIETIRDVLLDLDTGEEFNWKQTPITKDMNVTVATFDPYAEPPSPVTPGEFIIEPPTLINLGFEWYVDGDDNANATVAVSYREVGATEWKQGMNLLRTPKTFHQQRIYPYQTPNMFAGSILDLQEDTEYECKFVMSDPDGVIGNPEVVVTVRTRPEPKPADDGAVYHVYPYDWSGPKQTPNFQNLMAAYYEGWANGDWSRFNAPRVKPGDTILVHAGVYKDNVRLYSSELRGTGQGTPFDGTYYLIADGTAEKPIAIKAAGDGPVIFDGGGNYNLFNVQAADYNYFEGLTFVNTKVAILAGVMDIAGCNGLSVKNCHFEDIGIGIEATWSGSKNYYVADNTFLGLEDRTQLMGWNGKVWGVLETGYPELLDSYYAIKFYGSGHVVCHNYVAYFHDGIDLCTYHMPDGYPGPWIRDRMCVANDIYNNFVTVMTDNALESDGSIYNTRVMRNLCLNEAEAAISMQPIYGGPVYWIRNIFYHQPAIMADTSRGVSGALKFSDPVGGLVYNNVIAVEAYGTASTNIHFRNNLILAEDPQASVFVMTNRSNFSSSDYNGFCPAQPDDGISFGWHSPVFTNKSPVNNAARITRNFATLFDYSRATGQDRHSILIDWDVFEKAEHPDRVNIGRIYTIDELDFRLKEGSAAIDAGVFIPNVTDDFTGSAPDIGALEYGKPVPIYGPRG
ncbi:MAG: hypothetical protein FWH49_05105 [Clostridiales bacterium]|nr:hypothetical protein [Clostridiales bacterium]